MFSACVRTYGIDQRGAVGGAIEFRPGPVNPCRRSSSQEACRCVSRSRIFRLPCECECRRIRPQCSAWTKTPPRYCWARDAYGVPARNCVHEQHSFVRCTLQESINQGNGCHEIEPQNVSTLLWKTDRSLKVKPNQTAGFCLDSFLCIED